MMKKTKKSKSGKRPKRKALGKGAKLFLIFSSAVILVMVIYLFIGRLQDAILKSKTVIVPIDMEIGGTPDVVFKEPKDIAIDNSDNDFYVSDFSSDRIFKFDPTGKLLFSFGKEGVYSNEATQGPGEFNQPSGMWVSQKGDLYVADTFNHRIQVFDSKGKFLRMWTHSFFGPRDVVGNNDGKIYVVDTGNHKIQVFDPSGNFINSFGGHGTAPGQFDEPVGCVLDSNGNLYVADSNNNRIEKFDPNGKFLSSFKVPLWHGKNLEVPYLACYQDNLYASNESNGAILRYSLNGNLIAIYKRQGGFPAPQGVAVDGLGRVYVTEDGSLRVARFEIPSIAGSPTR